MSMNWGQTARPALAIIFTAFRGGDDVACAALRSEASGGLPMSGLQ